MNKITQDKIDLQDRIDLGLKMTQKMIDERMMLLNNALMNEKWHRAAILESYVHGMLQIQEVFSQAVK